ncbi:AraC family transcriptional regulator [Streptosporangium sp. NBC_01639]|uniref:helix-turn-helix domain-containing protein n=1 Tax=Streptosporangium sp. NBC_01639 TaxID=2975948 RepID=UPI003864525C|nr:AraC family transcriptional regulator [Streptosporangium sp. NBC_01639]
MDKVSEESIKAIIAMLHENLSEEVTVDDMAHVARFSKFHFSRIFQRATGVSPGRFLSALRLQEAKRLLLESSHSVTEICHIVGYSAVGTFSSRFKSMVGMAPVDYRQNGGFRPAPPAVNGPTIIRGVITVAPEAQDDPTFIGVFPHRIPEGLPALPTMIPHAGPFELSGVVPDDCYVLARSFPRNGTESIAVYGPVSAQPESPANIALRLRRIREVDPPILPALLDRESSQAVGLPV